MTFLHYLALRLLGEPCCNECWSWHCPGCTEGPDDFATLIVLPTDDAFHCERCGQSGNARDLVASYCRIPDTVLKWMLFWYQRDVVHQVSAVLDQEKDIDLTSLERVVGKIEASNSQRYRECVKRRTNQEKR
jgi:hypothetical protein